MYVNPVKKRGDFADPFVLRFNGRYYLYCTNPGVKCWSSDDLLSWREEGCVTPEEEFPGLVPFAPEVTYENGFFYMYTSPHGLGHYVLRSESPLGPFRKITPNVGHSIDFSVFLDEDGRRYAFWADDAGILGCEMPAPDAFGPPRLVGAFLHGWTEGPFVVKRDGVYHLTYTGNHYLSRGYRIHSAVADAPLGPYRESPDNPLIVQTEGDVVGLGHSSTVTGPDLRSFYLLYHNLNPDRSRDLNVDRVLFSPAGMTSLGPTVCPRPAPGGPLYHAETLRPEDWRFSRGSFRDGQSDGSFEAWLDRSLPAVGAAEIHLRALKDGEDYGLRLETEQGALELSGCMEGFDPKALHCFRLEWDEALTVHLDHRLLGRFEGRPMRLGCYGMGRTRAGFVALSGPEEEPLFPAPCRLPEANRWRQQAETDGLYGILARPLDGERLSLRVDGRETECVQEAGEGLLRLSVFLQAGEREISITGAKALALYRRPETRPFQESVPGLPPYCKQTFGESWEDGALRVSVVPADAREGWKVGVMLRASQLADGGEGDDPVLGKNFWIGYRLCVEEKRLSLWKHRYDERLLACAEGSYAGKELEIRLRLNVLEVWAEGRALLRFADERPVLAGRAGLQTRECSLRSASMEFVPFGKEKEG